VEGCTGWRYVSEELAAAGVGVHLGDPSAIGLRYRLARNGPSAAPALDAAQVMDKHGRGRAIGPLSPGEETAIGAIKHTLSPGAAPRAMSKCASRSLRRSSSA
jgi:hypothetical protein